jgi:MFS family permease
VRLDDNDDTGRNGSSPEDAASSGPPIGQRRALGVAFLTLFLDLLGFGILIPIQPFYAESFGATPQVATLLGASYSLMQLVFAPMWGALSDRVGRRPVVLVSIAISAVGFLVFGMAHALWMLFAARMIAGFGNANLGTVQAIVADVTEGRDRAKGMGMVGAALGLGFVFGPAVGGTLGAAFGPSAPAFASAGLAALNWILAFVLLRETRRPGIANGVRRRLDVDALRRARGSPNVVALVALVFVFTVGFSIMESALAFFVEHVFVPPEIVGTTVGVRRATQMTTWVLLAVGVTAVVVQGGLIRPLRKRAGEKALIVGGTVLVAASFVGVALVGHLLGREGYASLFPVVVVLSFGAGIFSPSQSSLLSRSTPADEQGAILGLGQSGSALGRLLGATASGTLFSFGPSVPFAVGAALVLVGTCIALALRDVPESTWDSGSPASPT